MPPKKHTPTAETENPVSKNKPEETKEEETDSLEVELARELSEATDKELADFETNMRESLKGVEREKVTRKSRDEKKDPEEIPKRIAALENALEDRLYFEQEITKLKDKIKNLDDNFKKLLEK